MKVGKLGVNMLRRYLLKDIQKRRLNYPPHIFKEKINIPYIKDGNAQHSYDVYLANEENRKRVCVIDIHGGSYVFGDHQDNYPYGFEFLKEGFDVVLVDYVPNDGKHDTYDLFLDVVSCINHLIEHLKEYDLDKDKFVICGDSAGGHLALLLAEALLDKNVADILKISLKELVPIGVVVSSPVYDFYHIGEGSMTRSGLKRMFGPQYRDRERFKWLSPRTYIRAIRVPLFISTCVNDFIRNEPLTLRDDVKDYPGFTFIDVKNDHPAVDHVHNVTKTKLDDSIKVNKAAMEFINSLIK